MMVRACLGKRHGVRDFLYPNPSSPPPIWCDVEGVCSDASGNNRTALHFTSVVSELTAPVRSMTIRCKEQSMRLGVQFRPGLSTQGLTVPENRQMGFILLRQSVNKNGTG